MRPRPDAAENISPPLRGARAPTCFNEAAARCRGKLLLVYRTSPQTNASMRPRPDAAENGGIVHRRRHRRRASMRPRPDAAENGSEKTDEANSSALQ